MKLTIHPTTDLANEAAAELLATWLVSGAVRTVMPAAGNTPLDLYGRIAARRLRFPPLTVFVLDEYLGVPSSEPRTCTHLLRRRVAEAWGLPTESFYGLPSDDADPASRIREHERRISGAGGLDVLILGLGLNGHLGFNEPGSPESSEGRVVDLTPVSIEANRRWFDGAFVPTQGITVGMRTILGARRILLLAYGAAKAPAVRAMLQGPRSASCPASLLQGHPEVHALVDRESARDLEDAAS